MKVSQDVICPECGANMVLRRTDKFKWKNGEGRLFFGCSNFPKCHGIHGAHPDGSPLGIPGNKETKLARNAAHLALDALIEQQGWAKKGAYAWLGLRLGIPREKVRQECHIAMFDVATCAKVVAICTERLNANIPRQRWSGSEGADAELLEKAYEDSKP
jgi:ssDNA-binding Zn-finger/Zn-ribbon topoisomerase 1